MATDVNDARTASQLEVDRRKGLREVAIWLGICVTIAGAGLFFYGIWQVETAGSRYFDALHDFGYMDTRTIVAHGDYLKAQFEQPYYMIIGGITAFVGLCITGYSPPGLEKKDVVNQVKSTVDKSPISTDDPNTSRASNSE